MAQSDPTVRAICNDTFLSWSRPNACCLLSLQLQVLKQIKADSGAYKLVIQTARKYVGIIAEGKPDPDDGGVDIAIVYRGTITGVS
jgi:hypothetical protein